MDKTMDALLAEQPDHNVFLMELAAWLAKKARHFNLKGSFNDVTDAADMLNAAAGSEE